MSLITAQRQENDSLHRARGVGLNGEPKDQASGLIAERQPELLRLRFLPAECARCRFIGRAAIEADRYLIDQENEMVAVIHDAQPRVCAGFGDTLQPLLAERVGATADRPVVIAHLIGSEGDGIPPCVREEPTTDPQALLGEGRVKVPGKATGRARLGDGVTHA